MKRSRFSDEQIIGILKEHEAGVSVADLCRKHGVSDASIYKWKAKFGGLEVSEAKRLKTLEDENTRLKRLLADAMLDNAALKDLLGKKLVTPAAKRKAVAHLVAAHGMSERRACKAIGCCRMTMRYQTTRADEAGLRQRMRAIAQERRRFGYRRLHVLLKREGYVVNHKKLFRLYREERLAVRRRGGRKRAIGTRAPMTVAMAPNDRWSLDFVSDQLTDGRRFRILTVVDDCTRECLALVADTSLSGSRVARELDRLIIERGKPKMVVSDNGTELTSNAILTWADQSRVAWHYIAPGKPTQNAFIESFMYRRPRGCKGFSSTLDSGRVRSCIRPVSATDAMAAGPDGDRGSRPHQRVALVALKALRACSIPSSAGVHHAVICPHTIRWPTYAESQAASLGR
ncbi:IS3 family transposase [Bradyrhizobium barranii]|uniref:IS3 family transposase n=1 Tax=Bradyrhizobium barranii TaxID=2992140 RepID=UPI0038B9CDFA